MMSKNANTAAIRIAHLKEAMTAVSNDGERSSAIMSSLEEEIEFLLQQIENDLKHDLEDTIAQPIAPNI